MEKEFQEFGYQGFTGGNGANGEPTYDEVVGKVATVTTAAFVKDDGAGPMWRVTFAVDGTQKIYTTNAFLLNHPDDPDDATVDGVTPLSDLRAARERWLGKKFWLLKHKLPELTDGYRDRPLVFFKKYTEVTISDVLASAGASAARSPVRLVVRAQDLREGFVDINVSDTNVSKSSLDIVHMRDRFENYFSAVNPRSLHSWPPAVWSAIEDEKIFIGMTDEQAQCSWDKPEKVNRTVINGAVREQWIYRGDRYIYLDNGVVVAIQN